MYKLEKPAYEHEEVDADLSSQINYQQSCLRYFVIKYTVATVSTSVTANPTCINTALHTMSVRDEECSYQVRRQELGE